MWIEKATVSRVAITKYGVTSNYVVGFRSIGMGFKV